MVADENVASYLLEKSQLIKSIEQKAERVLESEGQEAYAQTMREKALVLASLAKDTQKAFPQLDEDTLLLLQRFSDSAENALRIGSVFYMSALLYPEDYVAGQPNNLDVLAAQLAG